MSSDTYERVTVDKQTEESKGRLKRLYDTLSHQAASQVETVTRQARFKISGGGVDQVDAPDDLDELVAFAKTVGFVWRSFDIFAQEVWEPGYRLEGPDETIAYLMGESEDLDATPPEGTPEGGFLSNAGIYAGEKHQDFYDLGKETTRQRRLRGTVLLERLKDNPDNADSELTGWTFIRPETVSAEVYPNSNILIDPDDTDVDGVETTKRGEAAAYVQFDDNSILGRRRGGLENDEIPLSQNDVFKQVLNPGIGDDIDSSDDREQGIFGVSDLKPVKEDIAEYRNIKRNESTAIANKAHGMFFVEHGVEVLDLGNGQIEIREWGDESMDDFESRLDDLEPGGFITHDGSVTPERVEGEVPDLDSVKENYINDIISGLPVSKFKLGHEDNINRDVTSEQVDVDQKLVSEEREYQERQWTKELREVCNRKGLDTEGLQLKIEPEPEDSPVLSLSSEEIEKLNTYAQALNTLAGPSGGPETLVDTETLLTDVAQLPESVNQVDDIDPEATENPDAMAEFMDIMEAETDTLENQYSEGDEVDTPDGVGVVVEIRTEDFEGPEGDTVEASDDSPTYIVGVESGAATFKASELTEGEIETDVDNPEEDLAGEQDTDSLSRLDVLQETTFGIPDSWQESSTPNRIILLKAWAGLGGRFTSCTRKMRGELTGSPDRFCASMKDRVLQWEGWRR